MNMNRTRYGRCKGKKHATGAHRRGTGDLGKGRFGRGRLPKGRFGTGDLGKGRFGTPVNKPLMRPRAHIKPFNLARMSKHSGNTSSFSAKYPSFSRYFPKHTRQQVSVARRGLLPLPLYSKTKPSYLGPLGFKKPKKKQPPPPRRPHFTTTGAHRRGMQSRSRPRFIPFLEKGREQASMSRSGGRFLIGRRAPKRFGYTTVPNSMERTAPKKGHVNRYLVSSASGNSNRKNPPVSKWNPGPMRLNRIWSQFTPRFGTAAAGSGTLANFHSHFGALGTPMNLYSPYEAEQLTRRNMALGPTMADSTARVAAGTVQRPYVPRHAAQ